MTEGPRQGREGSRWINHRPIGEEMAEWFRSVPLHDGMRHEHYIGGVTLIPAKEKANEVIGFRDNGQAVIAERENLVYTPYVKVDTRIAYFWRLMELREWVGVWEPVEVPGSAELGLPPGFFRYTATEPNGKTVNFVGCTAQVRVYEKGSVKFDTVREGVPPFTMRRVIEGTPVMAPPSAEKVVPASFKYAVDPNAVHKAATGAIGRALGMAGMLVIPGSGVATAEDMMELRDPPAGATPDAAQLPEQEAPPELSDEQLRERAAVLVEQLSDEQRQSFQSWAQGRKIILAEAQGAVLKGIVKKLERTLDGAPA